MPIGYHHGAFPPNALDWNALIPLIGPAAAAVARYGSVLAATANPALLLLPLTSQEAVLSSSIEGTHATMGEVLCLEAGAEDWLPQARRGDINEVVNYRRAMNEAQRPLRDLPLSQGVVCAAHRVLMEGARGGDRTPGEYRRVPVWIGPDRHDPSTARYLPINAEFESLPPFLDGNGRVGRMRVPLFLWQQRLIRAPLFYVSACFEADRGARLLPGFSRPVFRTAADFPLAWRMFTADCGGSRNAMSVSAMVQTQPALSQPTVPSRSRLPAPRSPDR